jgi:hypothetical protein
MRVAGAHLATLSPSFTDNLRLDSTPMPCGQSRDTSRCSKLAGSAGYGCCRSHGRRRRGRARRDPVRDWAVEEGCEPVAPAPRLALFELASLAITDPTGRGDWHGDVEAVSRSKMEDPGRKIHDGRRAVTPAVA